MEKELNKKLKAFDAEFDNTDLEKGIKQIKLFNEQFPREAIKSLTKEKYSLGLNEKSSFSWWVEFGTAEVAAMGGYASKHRLYFNRKTHKYQYPIGYKNEDECFQDIKDNLLKLYNLIKKDRLSDIDKINLPHNQKVKVSYLLNSDNFLPLLQKVHLDKTCSHFGIDIAGLNSLQKNREIFQWFRNNTFTKSWHTLKMSSFCYSPHSGFNLKREEEVSIGNNDIKSDRMPSESTRLLEQKKQIILYGPPGTGKTYHTKTIAVSFIND